MDCFLKLADGVAPRVVGLTRETQCHRLSN
jgi:hypothetical protein